MISCVIFFPLKKEKTSLKKGELRGGNHLREAWWSVWLRRISLTLMLSASCPSQWAKGKTWIAGDCVQPLIGSECIDCWLRYGHSISGAQWSEVRELGLLHTSSPSCMCEQLSSGSVYYEWMFRQQRSHLPLSLRPTEFGPFHNRADPVVAAWSDTVSVRRLETEWKKNLDFHGRFAARQLGWNQSQHWWEPVTQSPSQGHAGGGGWILLLLLQLQLQLTVTKWIQKRLVGSKSRIQKLCLRRSGSTLEELCDARGRREGGALVSPATTSPRQAVPVMCSGAAVMTAGNMRVPSSTLVLEREPFLPHIT